LFPNELEKNKDLPAEELNEIFLNKFPREVVEVCFFPPPSPSPFPLPPSPFPFPSSSPHPPQDQATMNVLTSLSQRIDKLTNRWYSKKYKHVADKAIHCLDAFFSWKPREGLPPEKILEERIKFLNRYVSSLPKNEEIVYVFFGGLIFGQLKYPEIFPRK
jgi:hypothetical protein